MSFIKIQGTSLFDGYSMQQNKVLVLREDGVVEAVVDADEAGEDIKKVDGILSPGFINCHCHLELSHMEGMIEAHGGLLKFVNQVVRRRDEKAELIPQAIEKAEADMIQNGIVAVGDICNTTDTLSQKAKGNLHYHNFVEVIGFEPGFAQQSFDSYKAVYDQYCEVFDASQVSLTPHAPYSVSEPLWKLLSDFSTGKILSVHNQETPDEDEWFVHGTGAFKALFERLQLKEVPIEPTGRSSIQTYGDFLNPEQRLLLIHNVHTSADDVRYINARFGQAFWCLCPNANYYISNRLPDIPMLIQENARIVLGTDSLASNYGLSIWSEMERIRKEFPQIELAEMLRWATLNGAEALGIANRYGSFEKGKRPGVVVIGDDICVRVDI